MKKRVFLGCCVALAVLVFSVNVSAATGDNLLVNGGFATDLSGWSITTGDVQWSNKDVNGSPSSGSAFFTDSFTNGANPGVWQCVLLPSQGPFDVGAHFLLPSGQGQRAGGAEYAEWYVSSDCSGTPMRTDQFYTPNPPPTDSWTSAFGLKLVPPAGSASALLRFGIFKNDSATGPNVVGYVDGTIFRPTSCTPAEEVLCLNGGRFRVTADWESTANGGSGHGVQFNDDSGYFWFFNSNNTEVVVKVLNACANPFNHYWVFGAGLTNVLVTLNVEDTTAGVVNHYINPEGTAFLPLQDTAAFDTCP